MLVVLSDELACCLPPESSLPHPVRARGGSAWEPGLGSHLSESPARCISNKVSPGTNKARVSRALGNGKQTQFLLLSGQDTVAFSRSPHGPSI